LKDQFKIKVKLTDILKECSVNDLVKNILDNYSFLKVENDLENSEWTEGEL